MALKLSTNNLKTSHFSRLHLLVFVLAFGLIGILMWRSFAATVNIPGIAVIRNGSSYNAGTGYSRYSMITVGVGDATAAGNLTGVSKKCVYMNPWSVNKTYLTGIPWAEASSNGWLLKSTSGTLLINSGYQDNNILDVRNPAARARYIQSVSDFVASHNLNCVFFDDVLAQISGLTGVDNSNLPAGYSTYADQEDAIVMFMSDVGTALKNNGVYIYGNTYKFIPGDSNSDNGVLTANFWRRIGPYMNGMMTENWMQSPTDTSQLRANGSEWYNNWQGWQALVNVAQSIGRDFYGVTYGDTTDLNSMRYGKASFMLDWNGGGGAFIWNPETSNGIKGDYDPWNPEWTTDIGTPSGAKYQVGSGWRREYSGGTVLVNPSSSSNQTFSLGATYKDVNGTSYTSVSLAPKTALILVSTTTSPPPPPAPTVSLIASPATITSGSSSTLTWSSTNATSCTASGSWSGSLATSGTKGVTLTATSTYSLTCTGSGGTTSANTTVTVNASTTTVPTIPTGLKAVAGDKQVTLTWNANPTADKVDTYQVYESDQNLDLSIPSTNASYVVTKDHLGNALVNGTAYSFRISAHNSAGYGDWTSTAVSATPTAPTTAKLGDLDGSGTVDITDLSMLLTRFGTTDSVADLDKSGKVDVTDLSILLSHYGT